MQYQPREIEIFYSYACRDSYEVFEWLRRARADGLDLDITWRPYAIQMGNDDAYWRRPWDEASSELRGFIAAEAARRQGDDAFRRFHTALEQAIHEELLELAEEGVLLSAAETANIDVDRIRAAFDTPAEFARAAERSHVQAEAQYGVFGTPTLIFPNTHPQQGLHVELNAIPPAKDAHALFDHITGLAIEHSHVRRLELTTSASGNVAACTS